MVTVGNGKRCSGGPGGVVIGIDVVDVNLILAAVNNWILAAVLISCNNCNENGLIWIICETWDHARDSKTWETDAKDENGGMILIPPSPLLSS